ncbi:MAG: TonB-dependent receptor plug domain-containing protein, partial [Endomicrobiia bacterium]|nr:TonB-dependent receptor plug domain-containing protein [Endomicrobiia bacterium]
MLNKSVFHRIAKVCFVLGALPVILMARGEEVSYAGGGDAYLSIERRNVTISKGATSDSFRAAANVTVIEKADIEKLGASTLTDVLRLEQGVIVRDWTGGGKTAGIDLRGFGETGASNVLVLVNGRRVNPIDMAGVDWAQIPLSAVERIEIIRGPSAVLYGDNATGGVINIITARPSEDKTDFSAEAGSYNSSALRLGFSGRKDETSYKVIASRNSTDGFRENSGVANSDINAFIVRETPKVKTSLDFGFHLDKYGMPGSVSETDWNDGKLTRTSSPLDEARTSDSYIQVSVESPLSPKVKNELTLSSRNRLASEYWRSWMSGSERKSDTTGIGNKVRFDASPVGNVVGGLEAYFSGQNIKNLDKNDIPTAGGATVKKDSLAVYVNDAAKLLDDKLCVELG